MSASKAQRMNDEDRETAAGARALHAMGEAAESRHPATTAEEGVPALEPMSGLNKPVPSPQPDPQAKAEEKKVEKLMGRLEEELAVEAARIEQKEQDAWAARGRQPRSARARSGGQQ